VNRVAVGFVLVVTGPTLFFLPDLLIPGWKYFSYENSSVAIGQLLASLFASASVGYFFSREWGLPGALLASFASAIIFFLSAEAIVNLEGGYRGTGGGAVFLFLFLPAFVFALGLIFSVVGGLRRRQAAKRRETR